MKVAIVTGASGAIGSAVVKRLVIEEYFVVGSFCENEKGIEKLRTDLKEINRIEYFLAVKADLRESGGARRLYDEAIRNFGHVDLLINNAGVDLYKLATETTEEELNKIMNVNFNSAYKLSSLVLEKMIERKNGNIINVSSIWGKVGASMESAYSASKSALIGLTKSLAKEVGISGIRVNCVCPGVIDTPMNARFSEKEIESIKEQTPLGRLGLSSEVADLVWFLSSDKSAFITGEVITVDGGFSL